jgi:hypothetical protein
MQIRGVKIVTDKRWKDAGNRRGGDDCEVLDWGAKPSSSWHRFG